MSIRAEVQAIIPMEVPSGKNVVVYGPPRDVLDGMKALETTLARLNQVGVEVGEKKWIKTEFGADKVRTTVIDSNTALVLIIVNIAPRVAKELRSMCKSINMPCVVGATLAEVRDILKDYSEKRLALKDRVTSGAGATNGEFVAGRTEKTASVGDVLIKANPIPPVSPSNGTGGRMAPFMDPLTSAITSATVVPINVTHPPTSVTEIHILPAEEKSAVLPEVSSEGILAEVERLLTTAASLKAMVPNTTAKLRELEVANTELKKSIDDRDLRIMELEEELQTAKKLAESEQKRALELSTENENLKATNQKLSTRLSKLEAVFRSDE